MVTQIRFTVRNLIAHRYSWLDIVVSVKKFSIECIETLCFIYEILDVHVKPQALRYVLHSLMPDTTLQQNTTVLQVLEI